MKSLFFICHLLVLYGMAVSLTRQYIYSPQRTDWATAQSYCWENYGNLATITTNEDNQKAVQAMMTSTNKAWIGLKRILPHINIWYWVDGESFSDFTNWYSGEPNDFRPGENCTVMDMNGWYDTGCTGSFSTICSRSFTLVKEKKTWEEALKHCRTHYTDLAFVDSATLTDLLKPETEQAQTTRVWTGLRFLDGKWFWVNGMSLGSLISLPSCPVQPYRCGAYNFNTNVWENRDCNEELNFLCYYRG